MKIGEINLNNAMANGGVFEKLMACNFNVNCLRPWVGTDGRTYISVTENGKVTAQPVNNTVGTLRKEDWIKLDEAIIKAAQPRLRLVADLRAAGLQYALPNGLGYTVLQTERAGDIGDAEISMDGMREGANERPEFDLVSLPLPIIHKDFSYSARQIAASRNGGSPLDTFTAELASRKVAEEMEKLAIGVADTYTFGGGTIYGLANYTDALTYTDMTLPNASGWTPEICVLDVLGMIQAAKDNYYYGPYTLYLSAAWGQYLDEDYKAYSDITLRERLEKITGISSVKTLDYLTGYTVILLQMTSDVMRMVIGMEITTVQWESHGGMLQNFKVMGIIVPQTRCDINGHTGIVLGS
jgi:uncharacterized linocin/CFP29 family protein